MSVGAVLQFGSAHLTFEDQEMPGRSLAFVAVGLVTGMVFWVRDSARHLRAELLSTEAAARADGRLGNYVIAHISASFAHVPCRRTCRKVPA